MKVVGVKEFRDKATSLMNGQEPILITRHGRAAGIYAPLTTQDFPQELRLEMFHAVTERIVNHLKERGVSEESVLDDFERFRSKRTLGTVHRPVFL